MLYLTASILLFIFSSCRDQVYLTAAAFDTSGTAKISFSFMDDEGVPIVSSERTIMANFSDSIISYRVTPTKNGTALKSEIIPAVKAEMQIEPGTWNFTFEAIGPTGQVIGLGTLTNQVIEAGIAKQMKVSIIPSRSGNGKIAITVQVPLNCGIDYLTAQLYTEEKVPVGSPVTRTVAEQGYYRKAAITYASVKSGSYELAVTFRRGGAEGADAGTFIESVNVVDNLASGVWLSAGGALETEWTFTDDDLKNPGTRILDLELWDSEGEVIANPVFSGETYAYACNASGFLSLRISRTYAGQSFKFSLDGGSIWTNVKNGSIESVPVEQGSQTNLVVRSTAPDRTTYKDYAFTISMKPFPPKFSLRTGTYFTSADIELSCDTAGSEIRYTLDDTEPLATSLQYSTPIHLETAGSTTKIKAVAVKNGILSPIATSSFTIANPPEMLPVAGGSFSDNGYTTTVSPFLISAYEITQSLYEAATGTNPSSTKGSLKPVQKVSWYDAVAFCNKLSVMESLDPVYTVNSISDPDLWGTSPDDGGTWNVLMDRSKNGYRLPTEAEWQFAATGGALTHNYTYSGGNIIANLGWVYSTSGYALHDIGMLTPNELGIYDMSGNVAEWCWDVAETVNGSIPTAPSASANLTDPTGPLVQRLNSRKRGGDYINSDNIAKNTYRQAQSSTTGDVWDGIRVVRTDPAQSSSVTGVQMLHESLKMLAGKTVQLQAEVVPYFAAVQTISSWNTSSAGIASVSSTGLVSALTPGIVYITATSTDGSKTGSCKITVMGETQNSPTLSSLKMLAIEPGTYSYGYQNTATVDLYQIGETEITDDQYKTVMTGTGSGSNKPVVGVNWYDAIIFCNKLSIADGFTPVYSLSYKETEIWEDKGTDPSNWPSWLNYSNSTVTIDPAADGYRIPTQKEWEIAARGGHKTEGWQYAGSNIITDVAWYSANSNGAIHDVKTKAPNELGAYDMSGNASEWCQDDWSTSTNAWKLILGGSFDKTDTECLVTSTNHTSTSYGETNLGFRVAR